MRTGTFKRKTNETDIEISIDLDGNGKGDINTGIGFFDHMLELFACHSGIDLTVKCVGDLKVDGHHTVEDIGIALGKVIYDALGDKKGIARYGVSYMPMDECLCRSVVDVSGRAYLHYNADVEGYTGGFDCTLIKEFFRAVTSHGFITLHIDLLHGENLHHKAEAVFKSFAHAFADGVKIIGNKMPSSKGTL